MDVWSDYEELDFCETALGELLLRRRRDPAMPGVELFEVRLGDAFLMSSRFHDSEVALARLALARLARAGQGPWDVVVGGLGLGHTAAAALDESRVGEVRVIEFLEPVIGWHRRGLVPLGPRLCGDARCRLQAGDFFALAAGAEGFDPVRPGRGFDAILLDIDHAPDNWLGADNRHFYSADGLRAMARHLKGGGVFALWSNDPPEPGFLATLGTVFEAAQAERVPFDNPYTGTESSCTVYLGSVAANASEAGHDNDD